MQFRRTAGFSGQLPWAHTHLDPSQFSRCTHLWAWPVGRLASGLGGNRHTSICLCQHYHDHDHSNSDIIQSLATKPHPNIQTSKHPLCSRLADVQCPKRMLHSYWLVNVITLTDPNIVKRFNLCNVFGQLIAASRANSQKSGPQTEAEVSPVPNPIPLFFGFHRHQPWRWHCTEIKQCDFIIWINY